MKRRLVVLVLAACGGGADGTVSATEVGSTGTTAVVSTGGESPTSAETPAEGPETSPSGAPGTSSGEVEGSGEDSEVSGESSGTGEETTTGAGAEIYDPNVDGPWEVLAIEGSVDVDGVDVGLDGFYPTGGPTSGPYPLIVVAHGFQLPPTQYTQYVRRLGTHGYVALTVDFKAELFGTNHVANVQQVLAAIDWAGEQPQLAGAVDTNVVGMTGHSLGGKLAVHAAALDERVRASVTLDPVDGSMMCDAQKCPDVTDMLPLDIPLGFVGETLDASGGFMSCAPEANNFLKFFAEATTPALAVTVKGANHMSFLDDVGSCGITCSFCQMATLDNQTVNALARAYVVAFYGRHLKGEAGYEDYLFGAAAQERYVEPGLVSIQLK